MNRLETELQQLSTSYFKRYDALVARLSQNELNSWQVNAHEFTDHGANHCKRVVEALDKLVPNEILSQLNESELYFLLCSAWLHDIGMMCRQVGEEKLEASEIRERHHELTKKYILDNAKYREYEIYSEPEARIIADICYCHRRVSIPSVCDVLVPIGPNIIHFRFLSALLRLADEMDMDYRRASECTMDLIGLRGDSVDHWKACQLVSGVTCEPQNSTIEVVCNIKSDDERKIATNAIRKLNQERQQTVPYFELGLKYNSVRGKLRNTVDQDEFLIILNDGAEQFFQQVYRMRKGEQIIFKPTIPIETLKTEFEQSKGEEK